MISHCPQQIAMWFLSLMSLQMGKWRLGPSPARVLPALADKRLLKCFQGFATASRLVASSGLPH